MATPPRPPARSAADFLPGRRRTLPALRQAAAGCRGCDLYLRGTQTVFGEGRRSARVVLVGEQPGDAEDRAGRPFVGPAGRVLDEALASAGIEREAVYVTNAVKHFKWVAKPSARAGGPVRRIHQKPSVLEVRACIPWLAAEVAAVRPEVVVALGATAALAILGAGFRLTRQRGEVVESPYAAWTLATWHPSAILRAPGERREAARAELVADLAKVAAHLRERSVA